MEKLDGGELFSHIASRGTFTEDDASKICRQMLEGVKYLHSKNIVHRDIKGQNILFTVGYLCCSALTDMNLDATGFHDFVKSLIRDLIDASSNCIICRTRRKMPP
jgi:serine/threonine protein kinase